ncbi:M23 family metallopeptidase [bacterium]|nr:M23 family metallopeptidase [bacterium]
MIDKGKIFIIASFFCGIIHSQQYIWPTNASHLMTSSLCEYRPGHFHAGIDIKTWNREGYDVYAVQRGHISRMRVSPYGYGKAVYLTLDNGFTAVYGHLSKFSPNLENRMFEEQVEAGKYELDLSFDEMEYRVEAGECLAFTGSTGIGVPHLHFEIRDSRNRPFNPLDLGFGVQDTRAPVIQAVCISPLAYGSHVNGDFVPKILKSGELASGSVVPVWGKIGLAVNVYDQADGASNRFSPVRIRLFVHDILVYQIEYGRFDFNQSRLIELDRDFRLHRWGKGEFIKLYKESENELPFYLYTIPESGILQCWAPPYRPVPHNDSELLQQMIKNEYHPVSIVAEDYWGNTKRCDFILKTLPLHVLQKTVRPRNVHSPVVSHSVRPLQTWMHDYVRFELPGSGTLPAEPSIRVWLNRSLQLSVQMQRNPEGNYIAVLPLTESFQGRMIIQVISDIPSYNSQDTLLVSHIGSAGGLVRSEDGRFTMRFPANAVYQDLWLHVRTLKNAGPVPHYSMIPDDVPLKKQVHITITGPEPGDKLSRSALYRMDGELSYLTSTADPETNQIRASVRSLGTYTVLTDTVPPNVFSVFPDSGAVVKYNEFSISACFSDTLSGIHGEDNYQIWIDDQKQIVGYDFEKRTAFVDHFQTVLPGPHRLKLILTDRSGNRSENTVPFFIEE